MGCRAQWGPLVAKSLKAPSLLGQAPALALCLRTARLSTSLGQPGLHRETLSQTKARPVVLGDSNTNGRRPIPVVTLPRVAVPACAPIPRSHPSWLLLSPPEALSTWSPPQGRPPRLHLSGLLPGLSPQLPIHTSHVQKYCRPQRDGAGTCDSQLCHPAWGSA